MGAHHHHGTRSTTRILIISLVLTTLFVVFETVAGFRARSLALLSDAGHNFTDAFALLLAALGIYWQSRPGDQEKTYGYQRAGVLAAFVNALSLVVLAMVLFYESYDRLVHPETVGVSIMMAVAGVALAYPTVRVRGVYLAVVTIAFGLIIQNVAIDDELDAHGATDRLHHGGLELSAVLLALQPGLFVGHTDRHGAVALAEQTGTGDHCASQALERRQHAARPHRNDGGGICRGRCRRDRRSGTGRGSRHRRRVSGRIGLRRRRRGSGLRR